MVHDGDSGVLMNVPHVFIFVLLTLGVARSAVGEAKPTISIAAVLKHDEALNEAYDVERRSDTAVAPGKENIQGVSVSTRFCLENSVVRNGGILPPIRDRMTRDLPMAEEKITIELARKP
jgi:hypothetical protein